MGGGRGSGRRMVRLTDSGGCPKAGRPKPKISSSARFGSLTTGPVGLGRLYLARAPGTKLYVQITDLGMYGPVGTYRHSQCD